MDFRLTRREFLATAAAGAGGLTGCALTNRTKKPGEFYFPVEEIKVPVSYGIWNPLVRSLRSGKSLEEIYNSSPESSRGELATAWMLYQRAEANSRASQALTNARRVFSTKSELNPRSFTWAEMLDEKIEDFQFFFSPQVKDSVDSFLKELPEEDTRNFLNTIKDLEGVITGKADLAQGRRSSLLEELHQPA